MIDLLKRLVEVARRELQYALAIRSSLRQGARAGPVMPVAARAGLSPSPVSRGTLLPTQFKKPERRMAVRLPSMIGGSTCEHARNDRDYPIERGSARGRVSGVLLVQSGT